jgi:HSP20 family protein
MWEDEDDDGERTETSIDRFFSRIFADIDNPLFDVQSKSLKPLFRLEISDENVMVALDLPGVKKEDIKITCTEDLVSVDAEIRKAVALRVAGTSGRSTRFERYSKKIRLPVRVDPNGASAKYRNGMVVVKLPILRTGKAVKIVGT